MVTVMGTSLLAGKSPSNGEKTKAIPLLFYRKKALSFSSNLVWVKVFPVAEVNFCVCSCSSLRMGWVRPRAPELVLVPRLEALADSEKPTFLDWEFFFLPI